MELLGRTVRRERERGKREKERRGEERERKLQNWWRGHQRAVLRLNQKRYTCV